MDAYLHSTAGPAIEIAGDLVAQMTNLEAGDVLFIDEVHRLNPAIEEKLYPAMEDYEFDLMMGQGAAARSYKYKLEKFTLVGATYPARVAYRAFAGQVRNSLSFGLLSRSGS